MTYCEHCGFANRQGSLYCNGCGHGLVVVRSEADEPLPTWLRQATVAGYLWNGELLLPDWLSEVRPFRELYGGVAVILPPPYNEVVDGARTQDPPFESVPIGEDYAFFEVEEEEGPIEGDLLLLDDLDILTEAEPDESTLEFVVVSADAPESSVDPDVEFEQLVASGEADSPETLLEADEEGESILDVIAGVLQDNGLPGVSVGPQKEFVQETTQSVEETASEVADANRSTHGEIDIVESPTEPAESVPPDLSSSVNRVAAVADSTESGLEPADTTAGEAAILDAADAAAVPETVHPEPELSESGLRFQSAVAFVLDPQPESPPRKTRRKGRS